MNHLERTARRPLVLILGALALLFSMIGGAVPASADETEEPAQALIIKGTIKNGDDLISGVVISVSGGSFSGQVTTGADGSWSIEVPAKGEYNVTIDVNTLPEGVDLREPDKSTRVANLSITSSASVLFPIGDGVRQTTSFVDSLMIRVFAGLNLGLLLAMAAIGISLIFGTTGLSNFAHGEMVTLGALTTWLFYVVLELPILVAGLMAILLTAAFGWAQDAGLWKPLRKRRLGINQMMIVSIGLSIVLRYLLLMFFGGETKVISGSAETVQFGPVITTWNSLGGMVIAVLALAGVALFLTRTRIGKATRAVSDNAALASATGIDVERIMRIVWVMAGALTGLAGLLYGLQFQANWLTGFQILLLLFAAVTLGGLGTALGATVGALIIGMIVETSALFLPTDLKYAAALVILIVVLIVRPQGVLGKKQRIG